MSKSMLLLSPEDIVKFKTLSSMVQIKNGEILFGEEEYSDYVYYIEYGYIKLYRNSSAGKVSLVSIRKTGDVFGLATVLTGTSCYVSAAGINDCKMWRMSGELFREMLYECPKLAVQIAAVMSQRMLDLEKVIVNLTTTEVDSRLAWLLLALPRCDRERAGNGARIDVQLTHQDIASMIGACRQTVTSTLNRFRNQGLIVIGKRYIEITNLKEMEQYLA